MPQTRLYLKTAILLCLFAVAWLYLAYWQGQQKQSLMLAFTSSRTGNSQIYITDSGSSQTIQLTSGKYDSSQPAWAESGDLVYAAYPSPLHLALLDRTKWQIQPSAYQKRLYDEYQPDIAPDGRIAAATNLNLNWDIVLYDVNDIPHLAEFNSEANELEPCWWDDQHLAFVSDREGEYDIYRVDLVTGALINLTNNPASDYNPSCSKDNRLAFTSLRDMNAEIYVLNLAEGVARNVTQDRANDFNPAWLPDGRLSFVSDREGNREIYILDLVSSQLTNFTQNPSDDNQPAWSKTN